MKTPLLELYYFDSCPYCQRVLNIINELKIKVTYKDIHNDINEMHKLYYVTGRKTVPCLFINGDPMHESLDIINWLKANLETLEKTE
ncbi:MAG: glutathione S-transferase N-terminal domain-containing protein [Bacteriovorax sp.]|nr:glutathione S-transferase N-terminal domain-containing protein [Bacteriovorax sp.]